MEEEIKLIQEKVNDIISKPSTWFFNWGIIVTFFTIMLLISVSFMIPYKEEVSCKVFFNTRHNTYEVKSPATGIIKNILTVGDHKIIQGQNILTIQDELSGKDIVLKSPMSGYKSISNNPLQINDRVNRDDFLYKIVPDIADKGELYCTGYLDKFEISKLKIGNPVSLTIEEYNKEIEIGGYISSIANYPDKLPNKYPFYIRLDERDINYLKKTGAFYFEMNANARVRFKNQKIAEKIFSFLN